MTLRDTFSGSEPPFWWPTAAAVQNFVITMTLAAVVAAVIGNLMKGLFTPLVDNNQIFKFLESPFNMIIGYFIGRREVAAVRQRMRSRNGSK